MVDSIVQLKQCLAGIWSVDDKHDWPVKLNAVSHLFAKEFYEDFSIVFYELLEHGGSLDEIGRLFGNPSKIFRCFDLLLKGMYQKKISTVRKQMFIQDILQCIQTLKSGSIFNEDGRNIIWNEEQVKYLCEKGLTKLDNLQDSEVLHCLIGLIKAYIEMLYFRCYDISQEIHGPYPEQNKNILLIREFNHLSPFTLWENWRLIPYKTIKIFMLYDRKVNVSVDSYNHLYQNGSPFTPHLVSFRIEVDGCVINDIGKVRGIIDELKNCIQYNAGCFRDMNWEQIISKYKDIFYYKLSPLFKQAEFNPAAYYNIEHNIKNGTELKVSNMFFEKEKIRLLLNLLI